MSCFTVKIEWLSKLPQKSAFQEWTRKKEYDASGNFMVVVERERKSGWNGHGKVLKRNLGMIMFSGKISKEDIYSLLEELEEP